MPCCEIAFAQCPSAPSVSGKRKSGPDRDRFDNFAIMQISYDAARAGVKPCGCAAATPTCRNLLSIH
jgi:hypothetical protein